MYLVIEYQCCVSLWLPYMYSIYCSYQNHIHIAELSAINCLDFSFIYTGIYSNHLTDQVHYIFQVLLQSIIDAIYLYFIIKTTCMLILNQT